MVASDGCYDTEMVAMIQRWLLAMVAMIQRWLLDTSEITHKHNYDLYTHIDTF